MKNLKQRAVSAFAWDYSGVLARQVATFTTGILLARLLTPLEFGLVGMVMVFVEFGQGIPNIGLSEALIQRKQPSRLHYDSTFVLNIILGAVLTATMFLAAPSIARFYHTPALTQITRVISPIFLLRSMNLVHEAWLKKRLRFDRLSQIQFVSAITGGVTGIILAAYGFGVWSLVTQILVTVSAGVVGFWVFSGWKPHVEFSLQAAGELWRFGIPLFVAGTIDQIFTRIDILIVGRLFNASTLGLFSRAKSLMRFVIRLSSDSIAQVTFPVLAEIQDQDQRFRRVAGQTLAAVSFAAFALSGWLYVAASPLILVLLTDKWLASAPLLKLFSLSAYVYPVNSVVLSLVRSRGHSRTILRLEIIKKTLYSIALIVGFHYGIQGYLIALAIVSVLNTIINMAVTGRLVNLSPGFFTKAVLPYAVASLVAAAMTLAIPFNVPSNIVNLLVSTAGFALSYSLLNVVSRTTGLHLTVTTVGSLLGKLKDQS